MSEQARLRTRIKAAFRPLYDDYIHPVRCRLYQRRQEGVDTAWLEKEIDRLRQVKAARDSAYSSVLYWNEIIRTASSKTHRRAAHDELDRYTAQYIAAKDACAKIENEISYVHVRRNRFGTKPKSAAALSPQLVVQPAI